MRSLLISTIVLTLTISFLLVGVYIYAAGNLNALALSANARVFQPSNLKSLDFVKESGASLSFYASFLEELQESLSEEDYNTIELALRTREISSTQKININFAENSAEQSDPDELMALWIRNISRILNEGRVELVEEKGLYRVYKITDSEFVNNAGRKVIERMVGELSNSGFVAGSEELDLSQVSTEFEMEFSIDVETLKITDFTLYSNGMVNLPLEIEANPNLVSLLAGVTTQEPDFGITLENIRIKNNIANAEFVAASQIPVNPFTLWLFTLGFN